MKAKNVPHDLGAALKTLRLLVKEIGGNYLAGLQAEVARVEQTIAALQAGVAPSAKQLTQMKSMLAQIQNLDVKPRKGRRRDVKELDKLITKLTHTAESW